ncbi:MAG: histidine kinase [Anaerolineales bacterium]|nr:histidine kinase [Anaerolineales bacterium]
MDSKYRSIFDAVCDGLIITDRETGLVVEANPAAYLQHGCTRDEFIGKQLSFFIHPSNHQALNEYILKFQSDDVYEARLLHTCQNGEPFYAEWRGQAIDYLGRSCFLGTIRDANKEIRSDQLPLRRGFPRKHEQDTLLTISHTLASTQELQPGLILDQLRGILKYTQGGIFAVEDSTLITLALRGTSQLEQSSQLQIHLQGQETLDILLNESQPIRIADLASENTQAQFFRSLLEDGAVDLGEGMSSWIWAPLEVKNRLIGGLGLAHRKPNYFTKYHESLAQSVADQVAITMVNAELYEKARALAVLEERQRLARDLHDAINQSLFTAGIIAEVIPRLWERDQALARNSLKDLHRLVRSAKAEMRALLAELRPSTLIDTDLGELIKLLGFTLSGRVDIPVVVNTSGKINIPSNVQIVFYRVCQEALNNIAKHAKASRVDIDLQQDDAELTLRIRDNGRGFDPNQTTSGQYGLQMMQERVDDLGAQLTVMSEPGQGTEITVRWKDLTPKEGK